MKCLVTGGGVLLTATSVHGAGGEIVDRNRHVYNVDYTFKLHREADKIDRSKDLKLGIPARIAA